MLIERDVAVPSRRVWPCFLSCFHIWRELLCVVLVSGMNKVTQYVWHSVLKGYESTFETHIPLKASQLLSVFWLFNCVQNPALRWGYRVTISSCMTLLPEVSVNMFESNKNLRRSAGGKKTRRWHWWQYYRQGIFFHFAWNLVCGLRVRSQTVDNPLRNRRWQKVHSNRYSGNSLQSRICFLTFFSYWKWSVLWQK